MGVKRPFDEKDFQVSSFKQVKQVDFYHKETSVADAFSSDDFSCTADKRGEAADDYDNYQSLKAYEHADEKELETSAPLSWVTSSSSEEDAGSEEPFYLPLFPEYFEFNFPRRSVGQFEDAYSYLMTRSPRKQIPIGSPRKQIPIGPNHQAEIPLWGPQATENEPLSSSNCVDHNEKSFGTCIISTSLSKYQSHEDVQIGQGRKDCDCLDEGSVRCVRQHVKEAREKLKEAIGDKKFADLGFYDMGEEVATKWTQEEERIFHGVIYSNPVSPGKNFWKLLSVVFPSKTSKDLVSYYFNVFMLRRRGVQNRSHLLEIDSDDDEWQGNYGGFFRVVGEDEDSVVESFGDEDVEEGSEDDTSIDEKDDAGDNSDHGNADGEVGNNGDVGAGCRDAIGKGDRRGHILKSEVHNDFSFDHLPGMANLCDISENRNVQEESSTSSESQLYLGTSRVSYGVAHGARESTLKDDFSGYLAGESNGSSDDLDSGFLLGSSDAKVWDESCTTVLTKSVDLLPTCNIIEEIFGPCTSKNK